MDSSTHSSKPDNRKKTSDSVNDPDYDVDLKPGSESAMPAELISAGSQHLHRKLGGKEIQLFAVGGAIGTCMKSSNTSKGPSQSNIPIKSKSLLPIKAMMLMFAALFVQMGASLPKGGPAGLFLGFVAYATLIYAVNECFAEMVTYLPIPSPFVRLAGFWVDDALSFAMGWNYFFLMAFNIPYEITAINVLLTYWTDKVPVAAVVVVCLVIYAILNGLTVRYFGMSEFYMSIFKVFLMLGLMMYTFVTMVGAGEAENPRKLLRKAYSSFVWRLMFFFIGGALCVGIVIPYNDEILAGYIEGNKEGSGTGAASPYVISMVKFGIKGLPDLVNALIMTSVLSAGNNVIFSAARTLHGMAIDGKAPQFFAKCNKLGTPYYAVLTALAFCLLSLLQLSKSSATVLDWLVGICTASYLLNYFGTIVTYLHFYASLRRQGIDRNTLPYKGFLQPYTAWTKYVRPGEADLQLGNVKSDIDLYEAVYEPPKRGKVLGYLNGIFE
ncbi:uncharacterized protein ATNIH1004_011391 [Aspergillus tanneri]|uniref:Amino acid permease/ SLC12A domain-containing protein n=1 Tax=Aspergillus tanneri TaxID=1220188 RepID=A0A5M9MHP2_9EURO|nr:uncharacterized protein ATNIH1004_011391 [Aspergillus tanneri]KAA8642447.1 hypothetical protein ATNIH1004_011391 [Aspergillus tanneri]